MNSSLVWVRSQREDYHDLEPEKFSPFSQNIINQLAVDTDVPIAGSPVTAVVFNGYISGVNADILSRQTNKSAALTHDEKVKVGLLLHATNAVVGYIETSANLKYPGNEAAIAVVLARFGLKPSGHGASHKHIFKVLHTASGSVTLECPSFGDGADYHWRWSPNGTSNWTILKSTHKSTVTITDLPKDARAYFSYDVSLPVGKGKNPAISALANDYSWSGAISEMVPL